MSAGAARRPVSFPRRVRAATRAEVLAFVRRGESVLVTLMLPVIALVFISWKGEALIGEGAGAERLVPSVLALALIASAFVSTAISTGFDRKYGVLRRLGVTPLGTRGLVCAKMLAVFGLVCVQTVLVLVTAAIALGWRFDGSVPALVLFVVAGTAAFAALGVLLAGTVSAELTLALSNALFVLLTLFGGVLIPATALGGGWARTIEWLPSAALTSGLATAAGGDLAGGALGVLAVWAIVATFAAARTFRWE